MSSRVLDGGRAQLVTSLDDSTTFINFSTTSVSVLLVNEQSKSSSGMSWHPIMSSSLGGLKEERYTNFPGSSDVRFSVVFLPLKMKLRLCGKTGTD